MDIIGDRKFVEITRSSMIFLRSWYTRLRTYGGWIA
jgi:hypothetical protein